MKNMWFNKISIKKVFFASVLYAVMSFMVHQIEAILTMNFYLDPNYFGLWSKLMMPGKGPPPPEFMITSLVFALVTGVSVTLIYYYLKDHLPVEKKKRIFYFADLMVGTAFVFSTLPMYLMFNVPTGLLVAWFISNFVIQTIGAWIMVKVIK